MSASISSVGGVQTTDLNALTCVRLEFDPRSLERVLDILANLTFPVNPAIHHPPGVFPGSAAPRPHCTVVEFPAYAADLPEVRRAIGDADLPEVKVAVAAMSEVLRAPAA
jgi:hypothetical protein